MKQVRVVYDYRIDIEKAGVKTVLSHSNIIGDMYKKRRFNCLDYGKYSNGCHGRLTIEL
ncbi:MAG: hypothetical protein ACI97P_002931 [Arcticibacterium sp.]|jgi:hypothetical protein